ncbi:MAG: acyl-CoA dehydrogenase family protein [Burkholderiaceae bacterium]
MNRLPLDATHEVLNQPPPLEVNLWRIDHPLRDWVGRFGADWADARLDTYGALAGGPLMAAGFLAERHRPELRTHDRFGHRIDQVEFHPAYHELMRAGVEHGISSLPWVEPRPGAQVARAALAYLHNQADAGSSCPLTMSFASVPVIRAQPGLAERWCPRLLSARYDPRCLPIGQKSGATIGMAMTEKQGGTDVRANTTRAWPVGAGGPGQAYELIGHKWFCSAPMSDAFLVLAQTEAGLSCFLLPRLRPDGSVNAFEIQRLKDKLGNGSNASGEVEFRGALAWLLGEPGRGVATIIEMVALTRFDCMIGSSALMRQALTQALHHAAHRAVSGRWLIDQPLMRNVLADLALESEAAIALTLRLAHALDQPANSHEARLARVLTAIGKFWVCKRAPAMINEAQECLGGAGYVEESIVPRLYREAPVNSIWEGSGNVQCLDVLRALAREPGVRDALFDELDGGHGDPRLAVHLARLEAELADPDELPQRARRLTAGLALALQASLLLRSGKADLAEAFIASRIASQHTVYGTLPRGAAIDAVLAGVAWA